MERVKFIILVLIVSQVVIPFIQEFYDGILHRHHTNNSDTFVDVVLNYINLVLDVIIINEITPYVYRYFEVR
jgi:hypothetical protein